MDQRKQTRGGALLALENQRAKKLIITLGVVVALVLSCVGIGSLYAFFSDKLSGSDKITVSKMGVSVEAVYVNTLTYGQGDNEENNVIAADSTSVTFGGKDAVAALSDGYVLPISIEVQNTSDVIADIYPTITFAPDTWGNLTTLEKGYFYLYNGSATASDIIGGRAGNPIKQIEASGTDTCTVTLPVVKEVNPGSKETVTYMLYFKRENDLSREAPLGNLFLTVSAKSVLPDSSVNSNWYGEDAKDPFIVAIHIFTPPTIECISTSSDNYQVENNLVSLKCNSLGSVDKWFNGYPYQYEIYRTTEDPKFNGTSLPDVGWESVGRVESGRVATGTEYTDDDIQFHTSYYYKVKSYDDYGKPIAESWLPAFDYNLNPYGGGTGDACDGGLVNLPDDGLRGWVLEHHVKYVGANWVKQDASVPVTENNFYVASDIDSTPISGYGYVSAQNLNISDLTGLQYVLYAKGIYLDNNDIDSIAGKMPPLQNVTELSLSGNEKLADEQAVIFGEILPECKTLTHLYLEDIGFVTEYIEGDSGDTYISEYFENVTNKDWLMIINLGSNNLTYVDVAPLADFKNLTHITLTGNTRVSNVAELFTEKTHANLVYLNLNGISAGGNDLEIIQTSGTKTLGNLYWGSWTSEKPGSGVTESEWKPWMMTTNFPLRCNVYYGGSGYWGVSDELAAANSTYSLLAVDDEGSELLEPEPTESSEPEPTESPEPEPTESPEPEPTESPEPEPTESPEPEPTEPVGEDNDDSGGSG